MALVTATSVRMAAIAQPVEALPHPLAAGRAVKAVLFDVDGTLYRQTLMRVAMGLELAAASIAAPRGAVRRCRTLAAYRRAQERLRAAPVDSLTPTLQIAAAAAAARVPMEEAQTVIERWMLERPLKYLRFLTSAGLVRLLDLLDRHGVPTGVLTDYAPERKLAALGLLHRFSLVLCATDPDVGCFKPHPRGFLRACERWQLDPSEVLMVGDRLDVDAAGAAAAGMASVIIGRAARRAVVPPNCVVLPSFERLCDVLDRRS